MATRRMFPRRNATIGVIGAIVVCSIAVLVWLARRPPVPSSPPATRTTESTRPPTAPTPRQPAPAVREGNRTQQGARRSASSTESRPERHREREGVPSRPAEPLPLPNIPPGIAPGGAAPVPNSAIPPPIVPGAIEPVAPLPTTGTVSPPTNETGIGELAPESAALARVLGRYQTAYSTRDASAAAAIWPGVDRRALSRAFERLQDQELNLQGCTYAVSSISATARCDGVLRYARRIGDTSTKVERHTWTIEFVKQGSAWHIVRVSAE